MNINRVQALIRQRAPEGLVTHSERDLDFYKEFLENEDIREYLMRCLTPDGYMASGVKVKSLRQIRGENAPGATPGDIVRPVGYLVVASSIGGNTVCFSRSDGSVYWVGSDIFFNGDLSFTDKATGEWLELPLTEENLRKAAPLLSADIGEFLEALLTDSLEEQLDDLD